MYLYVFIMLLIGIIGFYTQMFMLQAAKMEANQTVIADEMFAWHNEAYRIAKANISTIEMGAVFPCAMLGTSMTACDVTVTTPPLGRVTTGISFDSIVYKVSDVYYVVTYIQDDTDGFAAAGYSEADILKQMKKTDVARTSFGTTRNSTCNSVSGNFLFTSSVVGGDDVCYPTEAFVSTPIIPNGVTGYIAIF